MDFTSITISQISGSKIMVLLSSAIFEVKKIGRFEENSPKIEVVESSIVHKVELEFLNFPIFAFEA
jgi:hypothetical protein